MTRDIASKGSRQILGAEHPYFCNPMWGLVGDNSSGPAGTYYYYAAEDTCFFWNMLDQVLVRSDLLDRFDAKSLRILEDDGATTFLTPQGVPAKKRVSDHLPILFSLSL